MTAETRTLLYVEDDAPQRAMLADFLRARGWMVLEAESAEIPGETPRPGFWIGRGTRPAIPRARSPSCSSCARP